MQFPYLSLFRLGDKIQNLKLQIRHEYVWSLKGEEIKNKKVISWSLSMQDKNPCVDQLFWAFFSVLDIWASVFNDF